MRKLTAVSKCGKTPSGSSDIDADVDWNLKDGLIVHHALDGDISGVHAGRSLTRHLKTVFAFVDGRIGTAASFDGQRYIDAGMPPNLGMRTNLLCLLGYIQIGQWGNFLACQRGGPSEVGWGLYIEDGKIRLNLSTRVLDDGVAAETTQVIQLERWQHVAATYDGSKTPEGMRIYVDGIEQELAGLLDLVGNRLPQRYPLRIGASGSTKPNFQGSIDDVRIYDRVLEPEEIAVVSTAETISLIASLVTSKREKALSDILLLSYLYQYASPEIRAAYQEVKRLENDRKDLWESFPTVMVMEEMKERKPTFRLNRGVYDNPAEEVFPGTPSILPHA